MKCSKSSLDRGYVLKISVNGEAVVREVTTLCKNGVRRTSGTKHDRMKIND